MKMAYSFLHFFDPKIVSQLNDDFRKNIFDNLDRIDWSLELENHSKDDINNILKSIQAFDNFIDKGDHDHFGYHHWGSFIHNGKEIVWIFDYYDQNIRFSSHDPSDPEITARILQIRTGDEFWV